MKTITFIHDNFIFMKSCDEMTLRVWEFRIPEVIKCICEPDMHLMVSITLHPNDNWLTALEIPKHGDQNTMRKENFGMPLL